MEKYEQPGVTLVTKVPSEEYKNNYDVIFNKDKDKKEEYPPLDKVENDSTN